MDFYTAFTKHTTTGIKIAGESMTLQQYKNDCDINTILRKVEMGIDPTPACVLRMHQNQARMPLYGDFSELGDYQHAQDVTNEARRQFMALPAELRSRFGDDPAQLIFWLQNPDNRQEAERFGLIVPKTPAVVNPVPGSEETEKTEKKTI